MNTQHHPHRTLNPGALQIVKFLLWAAAAAVAFVLLSAQPV